MGYRSATSLDSSSKVGPLEIVLYWAPSDTDPLVNSCHKPCANVGSLPILNLYRD